MLATLFLQAILVVDDTPGPGVNFPDLPPAVAAAADGDILFVQPGTYTHFTLSGKGLRIVGSGSSTTLVTNPGVNGFVTAIDSVPATSIVYVDRLRFASSLPAPGFLSPGPRLTVSGATTRAALADLAIDGVSCSFPCVPTVNAALYVLGASVHATRCQISGGVGCHGFAGVPIPAGSGLVADGGALVHVSSSVLAGGPGASSPIEPGAPGGTAVEALAGSQVSLADCQAIGGNGGSGPPGFGEPAPGLSVNGAFARISGGPTSIVRGGSVASSAFCTPPSIFNAPGIVVGGGGSAVVHSVPVHYGVGTGCAPVLQSTGAGIAFGAAPLPVVEATGSLTLSGSAAISVTNGPANAPFLLVIAVAPAFVPLGAGALGEMLIDPSVFGTIAAGTLGSSGEFSLTLPLSGFSPGIAYLPIYLQAGAFEPGALVWHLSNATVVAVRP